MERMLIWLSTFYALLFTLVLLLSASFDIPKHCQEQSGLDANLIDSAKDTSSSFWDTAQIAKNSASKLFATILSMGLYKFCDIPASIQAIIAIFNTLLLILAVGTLIVVIASFFG